MSINNMRPIMCYCTHLTHQTFTAVKNVLNKRCRKNETRFVSNTVFP